MNALNGIYEIKQPPETTLLGRDDPRLSGVEDGEEAVSERLRIARYHMARSIVSQYMTIESRAWASGFPSLEAAFNVHAAAFQLDCVMTLINADTVKESTLIAAVETEAVAVGHQVLRCSNAPAVWVPTYAHVAGLMRLIQGSEPFVRVPLTDTYDNPLVDTAVYTLPSAVRIVRPIMKVEPV